MTKAATCEVLLLPHLPLQEAERIGPWLLGPVDAHSWASDGVRKATEMLLAKYDTAATPPTVVSLSAEPAGARPCYEREQVLALQRALSLAGLDGNPDVYEQGWAAYRAVSADNLAIEGWTIDLDEGWFSTRRGQLIAEHRAGLRLDDTESRIPVPIEVWQPEPLALDAELASALLDYLTLPDDDPSELQGQRVGAAIDWLTLAWQNTASVGSAPRVVFLRTALETLFPGRSWETARDLKAHFDRFRLQADVVLDRRLEDLLWSPTEIPAHTDSEKSDRLNTDLQDWFWAFNKARNRIVHEGTTALTKYEGPGLAYRGDFFWVAERVLREIVRTELSIAGFGDVWMKPYSRRIHRAASAAIDEFKMSTTREGWDGRPSSGL